MLVRKFGGTSVKNAVLIKEVSKIVNSTDEKTLVVVSALSGITNQLVELNNLLSLFDFSNANKQIENLIELHINCCIELEISNEMQNFILNIKNELFQIVKAIEILGEITAQTKAKVLAYGEILSSNIISNYFIKIGMNAVYADSRKFIKTNSKYLEADLNEELTKKSIAEKLYPLTEKYSIIVMPGFISSNENEITTTLGRGGSDYTAAILASYLNADSLEIWTDVNGILTSDPRYISNTKSLEEVSYIEASELAYFGAKVLHPKTIYPAVVKNIAVYVKNTYEPEFIGTKIIAKETKSNKIIAIAFRKGITVINIQSNRMLGTYGFLSRVFSIFAQYETPIDLVATSEVSVSLTIDNLSNFELICEALSGIAEIEIFPNSAIISAVGEGIRDVSGIAGRFFSTLKGVNITMISMGASEVNLSIVIDENDCIQAVELLHKEFIN